MIVFLYGSDSYRRQKELERRSKELHAANNLLGVFDFSDVKTIEEAQEMFRTLEEFVRNRSLFARSKAAVLLNLFDWEISGAKEFLKSAVKASGIAILLSEEGAGSEKYPFLRGKSVVHEKFETLKDSELVRFIEDEARAMNVKLSPAALRAISALSSGDSWFAVTELQKLRALPIAQEGGVIDVGDIDAATDYRAAPNIFAFINGVERFPVSDKIKALEPLFLAREKPEKIFNILSANRYLSGDMVRRLADYDIVVKSGRMEYEEVLLDLALS